MKAMILAAGEGTRLWPLTLNCPKVMLPLRGRPALEYTLRHLRSQGITEVAINLHYMPEAVKGYFGDGQRLGLHITYSLEESPLGTAGALTKLAHYFTETFLLIYGDILTDLRFSPLIDFHRGRRALATVALFTPEDPSMCGIVELDGDGRALRFVEKPAPGEVFSSQANAGIYVLEPEIIGFIPANTFCDFGHDLFPALIQKGAPIYGCPVSAYIKDIGTKESYRQAEEDLAQGRLKPPQF